MRQAEEELRLFHVGATRARERLLLSGVVSPSPSSRESHGKAVIERIVAGFEIDRERDSTVAVAAPEQRPGLEAAVRALRDRGPGQPRLGRAGGEPDRRAQGAGGGARRRRRARAPGRAQASQGGEAAALLHRDLGPGKGSEERLIDSDRALREQGGEEQAAAEGGIARGMAVHSLLEWSQANEWRAPSAELVRRISTSAEVGADAGLSEGALLTPLQAWLGSSFFAERIRGRREQPRRGAAADRSRRHRPARLDRPAGRGGRRAAADRRLQDRQGRRLAAPPSSSPAMRSSRRSTRSRSPRRERSRRSSSPTSSSSAPRSRPSRAGARVRSPLAGGGSKRRSPGSGGADQAAPGSAEVASLVASSSSFSSFRPSPTASSSAVQ